MEAPGAAKADGLIRGSTKVSKVRPDRKVSRAA